MRATTGHLIFDEKIAYADLAEIFDEVLDSFLQESAQIPEDPEYQQMLKALNRVFLEQGKKPEGYNRTGRMRLVFPMRDDDIVEFYISGKTNSVEIIRVTELLSAFLMAKGFEHEVDWDGLIKKEDML